MIRPITAIILLLAWAFPVVALEVRVDNTNGAPRLLVDGKPVLAQMFWGAPGGMALRAKTDASIITFEFVPDQSTQTGTLHFRFGNKPGEIFIDDVSIKDLDTGRDVLANVDFESTDAFKKQWNIWPPDDKNTVGVVNLAPATGNKQTSALHVTLKAPKNTSTWPDFHIYTAANLKLEKGHRYRASFWVRSAPQREMRVAVYQPGNPYILLGAPDDCFAPQIKLAANVGVNFVSFPIGLPWPEPGKELDFKGVDAACERVLAANPRALLVPRIGMSVPTWWEAAHRDAMMAWEDGSHQRGYAVPGDLYNREAAAQLAILIRHLEEKFGDRIAGYHPCGQNTGEWFYQDTWRPLLNGYSPADQDEWRKWLKSRYPSDDALQKSWNKPDSTLATATVPPAKARHAAPSGVLRDPATERDLIDFAQFQQELMADCVCALAKSVRQATNGKKLVVFFYGYVFEFGAINTGAPVSGHYALRRALNSPDIDVLCSPISYFDRALGQSGPAMTAAESVALAAKMWLAEDDTSTYLSTGTPPGHKERVTTLEETNHLLARNVAQESLRNFGMWWMDLGAAGWFNDPGMWELLDKLKPMTTALLNKPTQFSPEVAVVIDELSMHLIAARGDSLTRPGIYEIRRPLALMGAPYGQYLLDDVVAGKVKAKLYVFLNAWRLSAQQRQALLAATRGATVIWCYAPGHFDGDRASLDAMKQLTGFSLTKSPAAKAWAEPTESARQSGVITAFGANKPISPFFAVSDAAENEILAKYPDGSPAVTIRKSEQGASLFVGAPGLTPQLLRLAARQAAVHLFTDTDCNVYANGPYIALHGAADGVINLNTGRTGEVRDLLTGQSLGQGPQVHVPIKFGQTRVLECR